MGGMLLVAAGLVWLSRVPPDGAYLSDLLGPMIVAGAGLGFSFVPVTIGAVAGTKPHEAGLASGLINTSQQVGGALGLAVLAAVADSRRDSVLDTVHSMPAALTEGFQTALTVGAGFAILGAILALLFVSSSGVAPEGETGEVEAVPAPA